MSVKNKFIIFSLLALVFDQAIKYYFYTHPDRVGVFGYYLNQNFSWSLPVSNIIVIFLTIPMLLALIYWRAYLSGPLLAWCLVGAGAVSNLLDRLWRGGVVDYIHLPGGGIINLADLMILGGMVWVLLSSYASQTNKPIN